MAAFATKRNVLLFLLLLFAIPLCVAVTQASQASADDSNDIAYVEQEDGSTQSYGNFNDAWSAAKKSGATLHLLKDLTTSDKLTVESGVKVAIDLQGHMINRNNVDTSEPEYASDSSNSGSVFKLEENAKLTVTSEVSTTAHNGDLLSSGRFWHYNEKGSTTIYGGLITGGATDSSLGGGGIALDDNAELVMSGVTVAGNIADCYMGSYGYGGAISLDGEASSAKLTNCNLVYNYADHGGGAVDLYDNSCSLKMEGGTISNNHTSSDGGGVYVEDAELDRFGEGNASVSLSTAEVSNNYASEYGGGLYLGGLGAAVSGGTITENSAGERGGGVYVEREDCKLDGCTITNNDAGEMGGGVLVENDNVLAVPALYLSGNLVIKDNTVGNSKSNLFLRNSNAITRAAKIYGLPSTTSEIWVSAEEDGVISYCADAYNDAVYYTDNDSKVVYWETSSSDDNYRFLKIGSKNGHSKTGYVAEREELKASEASTGEGNLQNTSYSYNGYPVYMGYSMEDDTHLLNAYYYSDGYFMESAADYNEHLASFAFHLACSAMNSSVTKDTQGNEMEYKIQASHAKQMLADIGVAEEDIFLSPTYFEQPTTDSIACSIGSKELENSDGSDSGVTLVTIGVRGQGYESEWASNVTLGGQDLDGADETAEHSGFAESANNILVSWLEPYLEQRGLDKKAEEGKVRFLVTGFSRAGAVSNLLAKQLITSYEFPRMVGDNHVVFGYTFEAPQGGNYAATIEGRSYSGIHNVLLSGDIVPYVAMSTMNFQRYGVDHYLGGTEAGTASKDVIEGEGAESEGQAKRYSRKYAGWLSHAITLDDDGKIVANSDDWKSTHFMKDNDYYEVGTEEYSTARKAMLKQLAACNGKVNFDDYFHLATITVHTDQFTGNTEEVGSDDVKLAQFLDDFMFYANAWLINGQNLQQRSSRAHYVTEFQYGDSHASYEETARTLMAAVSTGKLKTEGLTDKILTSDTASDIAKWALGFNDDTSTDELIRILTDHGIFGEGGIPLTEGQAIAFSRMALNYVSGDWDDVSDYMAGTSVDYDADDEYLVMTGTLLYNIDRIMLNHTPDVVCAWLRSEDSYYVSDEEISSTLYSVASATTSEVSQPYLTMKVNGEEVTVKAGESCNLYDYDIYEQPTVTDVQLHNEDGNAGGMVFYTDGDGSGVKYKDYSYYDMSKTTLFDGVTDWSEAQQITAHTVWYNTSSENATFSIYYEEDPDVHSVYVNGELFGKFKTGTDVVVSIAPEDENHVLSYCQPAEGSAEGDEGWWSTTDDDSELKFVMPGGDVYWEIGYAAIHKVTFDTAGGSKVDEQTVTDGECATKPDDPTRSGFKFDGWYLEDGTAYDFAMPVTSDVALYARWSASGEPSHTTDDPSRTSGGDNGDGVDGGGSDARLPGTGDDAAMPVALLIAGLGCVGVAVLLRRRRV